MDIEAAKRRPLDMRIVDATDDDLIAIQDLRSKLRNVEDRPIYVKGLYYISLADSQYSEEEKALVEGIACALGVNEDTLEEIKREIEEDPDGAARSLSGLSSGKLRGQLFEEMAKLTYLKGYQLATEDEALTQVAPILGIKANKADKILSDLYMGAQGFDVSKKSAFAKVAIGAGAIAAGAAVCAVTAGAAAPAIGAAIGGLQGLSGAAAVNAGLAALGGGSLVAGGGGIAAGTAAVVTAGAVAGGGAAAVGVSVKENISAAHDKKKLQATIRQQQRDNMTKQEITENLIQAIEVQKARLVQLEDLHASRRDIAQVERDLANLQAQKAEVELGMR